jgi:hypothetical protein
VAQLAAFALPGFLQILGTIARLPVAVNQRGSHPDSVALFSGFPGKAFDGTVTSRRRSQAMQACDNDAPDTQVVKGIVSAAKAGSDDSADDSPGSGTVSGADFGADPVAQPAVADDESAADSGGLVSTPPLPWSGTVFAAVSGSDLRRWNLSDMEVAMRALARTFEVIFAITGS